jgi:2,3-diaminopropionate biosynthesis protein SbnA
LIYRKVYDVVREDVFLELPGLIPGIELLLKLEGLNPAGSIKLKTAVALLDDLEKRGLGPGSGRVIESSSGNLGVALAVVCASRGYELNVVTDPNATRASILAMRALGAQVTVVTDRDAAGGYLQTRLDYIAKRLAEDPFLHWPNQYANPAGVRAHRDRTAAGIHRELGPIDVLAVGAGTTGTLMGCLEYFTEQCPGTRVIAVDALGSLLFGGSAGRRMIPGLGVSRVPELFRDDHGLEKAIIAEVDTIAMCRRVAREHGLLVGGSTGTVLAAVQRLAATFQTGSRVVVISPDLGERYLETVYDDEWVEQHFSTLARA